MSSGCLFSLPSQQPDKYNHTQLIAGWLSRVCHCHTIAAIRQLVYCPGECKEDSEWWLGQGAARTIAGSNAVNETISIVLSAGNGKLCGVRGQFH